MLIAPPTSGSSPVSSNGMLLFGGSRKRQKKKGLGVHDPIKKVLMNPKPIRSEGPERTASNRIVVDTSVWAKLKSAFYMFLLAFSRVSQARAQPASEDPRFFYNTVNATPGRASSWSDNVDVLASASQRHFSIFDSLTATGFYTQALTDTLCRDDIYSLGEAHSLLQEEGYPTNRPSEIQTPVSTYNVGATRSCLEMWGKDAPPNTTRFALLLVNGKEIRANLKLMKKTLKNVYHLPESQILTVKDGKNEDFRRGLRRLMRELVIAQRAGKQVEALVYYSGHGTTTVRDLERLLAYSEGEAQGQVQTANGLMTEKAFRELIERYLPEIKTLLILDSCHSGSWIG